MKEFYEKNSLSLYKSGNFYNAFNNDGIILHFLLGYKYISYKRCTGFPVAAYSKVIQTLENEKINYKIYEKDKLLKEYKGISKNYSIVLKKAINKLDIETRMNLVKEKIDSYSNEKLERLIGVIENIKKYIISLEKIL